MDKHVAFLQTVCRAGGEKLRGRHYPAIDFKDELKACFGMDIAKDNPEVHPPSICIRCQLTLKRAAGQSDYKYTGGGCNDPKSVSWGIHKSPCPFCESMKEKKKGGRPKKQSSVTSLHVNTAALREKDRHELIAAIESTAAESDKLNFSQQVTSERFLDANAVAVVLCKICQCFPDHAVESACCKSFFCGNCLTAEVLQQDGTRECPSCEGNLSVQTPSELFWKLAGKWSVHCDNHAKSLVGCPLIVPLERLQQHVHDCPFSPGSSQPPVRSVRPSSTVADILTASPKKLRGNVATQLTGHLVSSQEKEGRLEVKTSRHGKPKVHFSYQTFAWEQGLCHYHSTQV